MASVIARKLTRFSEKPSRSMTQKVGTADSGRATAAISVARQLRRNSQHHDDGQQRAFDQRVDRGFVVAVGVEDRVIDQRDRDVGMRGAQLVELRR